MSSLINVRGGSTAFAEAAAELVRLKVDVLYVAAGPPIRAVLAATQVAQ